MDEEVWRLRRLRATALRVRALARVVFDLDTAYRGVFSRTAASCWRVARTITGRLRAHPHSGYQRDASVLALLWYRAVACNFAYGAKDQGVVLNEMTGKLRLMSSELADARALTWSADLSAAFSRSQLEISRLIDTLENATCNEAASAVCRTPRVAVACNAERYPPGRPAHWPYLLG